MDRNDQLMCDPQAGACEIPTQQNQDLNLVKQETIDDKVNVSYFTDPICSACWAIEPQLKKLKLEYGQYINLTYCMGGLLPSWTNYNGGGIQKPSDVAHHWDEISGYYQMPIDGNIWLEDPLSSSYPPSVAFKAAEIQNKDWAAQLMRVMREMLFVEKINMAKWENICTAAQKVGLDVDKLKLDYDDKAQKLFKKDLELTLQSRVRGFPTLVFYRNNKPSTVVYGVKPYEAFEQAILKEYPGITKNVYAKNDLYLISYFGSLTAKELSVLSDISLSAAEQQLQQLVRTGKVIEVQSRNGNLWRLLK